METIVGLVFTLVGAGILTLTIALTVRAIRRLSTWTSTRGVVTGNNERTNRDGKTLSAPVIEFTTRDGRTVSFTSSMATSWRSYRTGDTVKISYSPDLPENAEIVSFARLWLSPLTFVILGSVFLGLGVHLLRHG